MLPGERNRACAAMADDNEPFYSPPQPSDHVWTLRRGVSECPAELRDHSVNGVELQVFADARSCSGSSSSSATSS